MNSQFISNQSDGGKEPGALSTEKTPASIASLAAPKLSSCPKRWEEMTGDARTRYCEHCCLHVHNLSEMPRREAEVLMNPTEGRVCVTYIPDAEGNVLTLEQREADRAAALESETETEAVTARGALTRGAARYPRSPWTFGGGLLAGIAAGFATLLGGFTTSAQAAPEREFATPPPQQSKDSRKTLGKKQATPKPPEPQPMPPGGISPMPPSPPSTNNQKPPQVPMGKILPPSNKSAESPKNLPG